MLEPTSEASYTYDATGNRLSMTTDAGTVNYSYNVINPLKLVTDKTWYLYDGLSNQLVKEYTGNGSPLSQYYNANGTLVCRKMFGNHGLTGRDPVLKTNGGMM